MIRAALGALLLLLGMAFEPAQAQSWIQFSTCGTPPRTLTPGSAATIGADLNGNLCISGSISASLSGFAPATTGTPFTADTNAETGTLPVGAVVVASNTSTTIPAYCKLGASATVADQLIAPSSWFAFTVGASTQLTCITASSTAIINMVGGSGLPTGAGGGGGSGGGSVTQGTSPWVVAGNGTAGTAASGVLSVQGIASMTPVQVTGNVANVWGNIATGTGWTSGTADETTQVLMATTSAGAAAILVQLVQGTTISGGQVTFEGTYDNTNWVTIATTQMLNPATFAPLTNPYTLVQSTNQPFLILTQGYQSVRLRLNTVITGSGTVTPFVSILPYNPTVGALLNSLAAGTNIIGKVGIDQTTVGTTNAVSVFNSKGMYETVAASQTGQTLGPTGATGDYLSHCTVYPTTTTPGVVTVFDNTSSATNNVIAFPGGASSITNLVPFSFPVGAFSLNGPWKVTTGANLVVTCYGKFT